MNQFDVNAVQILHQNKVFRYVPSCFSKEVAEAISLGRTVEIQVEEVKPVRNENWYELVKVVLLIH